ncbi:MAG: MetQ/NlpA family ABC transporter substrate-binding protein [Arachnia sp.]
MRRILTAAAASLAATLALTACGGTPSPAGPSTQGSTNASKPAEAAVTTLTVGASPVPHGQILEFIQQNLAKDAGLDLKIVSFDDYVLPNQALASKELDANYFQHLPYLEAEIAEKGYEFTHGEGIHIEPLALFSDKHTDPAQVPDGGTIAITNDPSNQWRGLKLLEKVGLLKDIKEGDSVLTLTDAQNPKGLTLSEAQPEVVVTQLTDPKVDAATINGNFILNAGLKTEDAIAVEEVAGNPYANILVWRTDDTNPAITKLDELLHSDEVAEFIKTTWPAGNVIPG